MTVCLQAAATQTLRMQNAQTTGIQFQKDEVIHCPSCEQLMRAPCEAAALRCASCRAVINPQDCVRSGAEGEESSAGAAKPAKRKKGRRKKAPDPPLQTLQLRAMLKDAVEEKLEGYRCDSCSRMGTTQRRDLIFLLPQVTPPRIRFATRRAAAERTGARVLRGWQIYIIHINRAGIGGEIGGDRHGNPVEFPDTLDLRECGMLLTPDTPLDWNLQPCSTEYQLFGACFHRGAWLAAASARAQKSPAPFC